MHVDVDELRAERAAEGGRQVGQLHAKDHVRPVVEDLELLQIEGARVEVAGGRVGVVAGPVVVAGWIGDIEQ